MRVVERPGAGALCNFKPAELQDVRRISLAGFPKHLLFYEFKEKEILVLRVLYTWKACCEAVTLARSKPRPQNSLALPLI
jgi:hypothetical protein